MGSRLLLVGWDSADWRIIDPLIDAGKMPVLQRLIETGTSGRLASLEPMVSPLLWTSIVTARRADAHGICSFTASDPESGVVQVAGSEHRTCHALWNILHREGLKSLVCNWFASHPAEPVNGLIISNEFPICRPAAESPDAPSPPPSSVHPAEHFNALNAVRVKPEDIDGSIIELLVPRAKEIDQENDPRLARLATLLAENFNVHSAFTYGMEAVDWDFAAVYYEAIDLIAHYFLRYTAPLMPGVARIDAEIYGDVVEGAYRLHDAMLGRLLELAGAEVSVVLVSDHGFHSQEARPASLPNTPLALTRWHRRQGILVMNGPPFRRDHLIYGAGLLDLVPTMLAFFNLPIGDDMEGRVLAEAFSTRPEIGSIPSWELIEGDFARVQHTPNARGSGHLLQRFIDLGYLAPACANAQTHAAYQWRAEQYFRAIALLDGQRPHEAVRILDELHEAEPERDDVALALGTTLLRLGLLDEAEEVVQLLEQTTSVPATFQLRADFECCRGNRAGALEALARVETLGGDAVITLNRAGAAYLQLRQFPKAEAAFSRSLSLDPENPSALSGLSFCKSRRGEYREAAELALEGISLLFDHFYSHYCYGIALVHLGSESEAIRAFENTLRLNPRFHSARHYLVHLFKHRPSARALLDQHRAALFHRSVEQERSALRRHKLREQLAGARNERARARREKRLALPLDDSSPRSTPLELMIVSGLPRSGTSLVMQMMEAAGIPPMMDDVRLADCDNPHGYYEWEEVKYLPEKPELIEKAAGRAVKIVTPLLPFLPRRHRYRIVLVRRRLEAVIRSQDRMRARFVGAISENPETIRSQLDDHLARTYRLLDAASNVSWIEVEYEKLVTRSDSEFERLATFCGIERDRVDAMKSVVRRRGPRTEH